ncbi:MAG: ankyrin repeat domain-containing protein [Spirochaetales bacterium]|nr:ankyrin repeat domain-containing protein [Spirochaetales bacterium]
MENLKEFMKAIKNGDLKQVQVIFTKGITLDHEDFCQDYMKDDFMESTPLHLACAEGHREIARFLIDYGADINGKDKWDRTPLYRAAYEMKFQKAEKKKQLADLIEFLILDGADIHSRMGSEIDMDYRDKSFLFWAVENNYPDIVSACIKKNADLSVETIIKQNPLYFAAEKGFTEICKLLIKAGADMNYQGYKKRTPLMLSAEKGHSETARLFIENKADITLKDEQQRTTLHAAAAGGLDWLVEYLIQKGIDVNSGDSYGGIPLGEALLTRKYTTAKRLIEFGSDVNKKGLGGNTPLYYACNAGADADTILVLLKNGADPNRKTESYNKETVLHRAAEYGFLEITQYLIEYRADLEIKDGNGETALCRAVMNNHFNIVKLLVQEGAQIQYHQKEGFSAMEYALQNGNSEIIYYLLDHCEDTGKAGTDIFGHVDRQLILAATSNDWSKIHRWLDKEADVNYQDEKGKTALFYAVEHDNASIVRLLLQGGADVAITDNDGKKAIDFIQADKDNLIKNLLKKPVVLFTEVENFARHLRGRVPESEILKATEILAKNEELFSCVSEKELKKLKTIDVDDVKKLIGRIEKVQENELYSPGICNYCGRTTLKSLDREVLHGNPSSPASDTEVVFHCKCLSCGMDNHVSI